MIEPLRTSSLLGLLIASFAACGGAPPPAAQPPAPDVEAKLASATQARTDLATQLAAAPHDILVSCQTTSGDCLISVTERREALVSQYYLNACRELEPEKQSACIAHELEQRGARAALSSFYETENWCSRKLLECMSEFANNAEKMAARQRIQDRRAQVEGAPESAIAERAPEFAKERVAFVRSILPPKGQAACLPIDDEVCSKQLDAPSAEFEAELAKAPASYDAKRALELYDGLQRAEAECTAPELACLLQQLPQYGANAEADKLLKQNLTLLTQQQQIRSTADPDAADPCISSGVTQHSDRIVSAYQAYAREPAAAPLIRLQKAFITMHQTQLWCLMPLAKSKR